VQVYTNTAGGATLADAAQPPTWNTAPAVVTATAPIAQSGSSGHWQSWDVTGLARQWAQDGTTNAGVTLARSGALVRVASALGVGADDPSEEPCLDISYQYAHHL